MEKSNTFKLSNDEIKKLNFLMPKGYKFVPRQEIIKKQVPKIAKKKNVFQPPPAPALSLNAPVITKTRSEKVKEEEYQPKVKVQAAVSPAAPIISPNDPPAGTSQKLLERVKKHEVFNNLLKVLKPKESDISLKEIEIKANSNNDAYRIADLEADIQIFCMMVYKNYAKTSNEYREAADLQNYLANLMKIEREKSNDKKAESTFSLQRIGSMTQIGNNRKKPQQGRNIYQPLAQSKLPTPAQKRLLGQMIKKLPSESLQQVCYIVFESAQNRDYIFDLDTLHVKKFRELQQYVKKHMEKLGEWDQRYYEDQQFSNESVFVIQDDE